MRIAAIIAIVLLFCALSLPAADIHWPSATVGRDITGEVRAPATQPAGGTPTIVYLKNLSIPRLGQEEDETILADFVKEGHLVLILDYACDANAISPNLNADLLKLRRDIVDAKNRTLLAEYKIDPNHLFILPEGFRLRRDVEFARDGNRILAMDVIYPALPAEPVPALMEITCDNKDRMGSSSLLFCQDTLMEGAAIAGFASAMIDHPVPPPYKGIDDPMPQCIHRLKAAVRTLRAMSTQLNLNGRIGAIGFSRGGPMAALLAVTGQRPDLEGDAVNPKETSDIQTALIHGGRYDYLKLEPDDSMYKRFEKAWGTRESNQERWAMHGASYYLTKAAPPLFLNTSDAESKEYQAQLGLFAEELTQIGVPHVYRVDADARGHRVTTNPQGLKAIYDFFQEHLSQAP